MWTTRLRVVHDIRTPSRGRRSKGGERGTVVAAGRYRLHIRRPWRVTSLDGPATASSGLARTKTAMTGTRDRRRMQGRKQWTLDQPSPVPRLTVTLPHGKR